jgi:DNA polymerase III epsilon subunit-like protein
MTFPSDINHFISVDVETSGPNPSEHSLLSIGACTLATPRHTFYIELQPDHDHFTHEALAVSHLSLAELAEKGTPPAEAMDKFEAWLKQTLPPAARPVFLAFNAPFDWSFVNDYFHRYLGHNPFGHNALDIKAFYMGRTGVSWDQTSLRVVSQRYLGDHRLSHNALHDAMDQADVFLKIMEESS